MADMLKARVLSGMDDPPVSIAHCMTRCRLVLSRLMAMGEYTPSQLAALRDLESMLETLAHKWNS